MTADVDLEKLAPNALLIEDDPAHQLWMFNMYKKACPNGQITTVGTLKAGHEKYLHDPFDVILLDLNLPDSQGSQTVERTKGWANGAAIIVLTGLVDDTVCAHSINYGADGYVEKDNLTERSLRKNIIVALSRKARKYESRALKMKKLASDLGTLALNEKEIYVK